MSRLARGLIREVIGRVWDLGRFVADRTIVGHATGALVPAAPPRFDDPQATSPATAHSIDLTASTSPPNDPSQTWRTRLAALTPNQLADAELVRRARAATRKLRTLLASVDAPEGDPLVEVMDELRRFNKRLGRIRDCDAALGVLAALARSDTLVAAVIDELTLRERTRRARAVKRAQRWLARHDIARLAQAITDALAATPEAAKRAAIERDYDDLRLRVSTAINEAKLDDSLAAMHELRATAKRLRYLGAWLASSGARARDPVTPAARRAQQTLGEHRDLALLHRRVERCARRAERRGRIASARGMIQIAVAIAQAQAVASARVDTALAKLRLGLTPDAEQRSVGQDRDTPGTASPIP